MYEAVLYGPAGARRRVALKRLDGAGDGLRREARLGGLLRHPNLVDVFEVGEVDGAWFCAMELCRGGSLQERRPMPPRAAVEAVIQVCRALSYAHRALGLVHLDLKPSNLLVDGTTVKVADLGVARAEGFPGDGRISGTRRYMSPEQARGAPVDARADLFALGFVLADLVSPAAADSSDTFTLDEPAAGVVTVEVPGPLAAIVERCTAPAPEDRFPDPDALREALEGLELDGPGLADVLPPAPDEEAWERPRAAFVGRSAEREAVRAALADHPVVALKGPSGVGKTRLARELAADGPSAFVALADVEQRDGVLAAVAAALDVPLGPEPADQLGHALAARGGFLLVLDGVERVVDALLPLVADWSRRAPGARFLLTSVRSVVADATVVVGPLPREDAVALLAARAAERGVEVADPEALGALAERLDGLPLALELAAGRLGVLSAAEVLERVEVSWLRGAREGREGTLLATLDAAWELLAERDRDVLSQLAVFRGGFSADLAAEVVRCDGPLLDRLDVLADASWVLADGARLRLLAPVREYAEARLAAPDEVRERHARALVATFPPALLSLRVAPEELANLEAATRWAAGAGEDALAGMLARTVAVSYRRRGPLAAAAPFVEVARAVARDERDRLAAEWLALRVTADGPGALDAGARLQAVVDAHGDLELRLAVRMVVADRALHTGRLPLADTISVEAEALAERFGDPESLALARVTRGLVRLRLADPAGARADLLAALRWCDEVGPSADATRALCLNNLGLAARDTGRAGASAYFREALEVARRSRDRRSEGIVLGNLAMRAMEDGDAAGCLALAREALEVHRSTGYRIHLPQALDLVGTALGQLGRVDEARAVLEEALALAEELGAPLWVGTVSGTLALLERDLGDLDAAARHATRAVEVLDRAGERLWAAQARATLAELELRRGRPEVALPLADAALAVVSERRVVRGEVRLYRARALAALGRSAEAHQEAGRSLQAALEDGHEPVADLARALLGP